MQSEVKSKLAYISNDTYSSEDFRNKIQGLHDVYVYNDYYSLIEHSNNGIEINAIITSGNLLEEKTYIELNKIKTDIKLKHLPMIVISKSINHTIRKESIKRGISEIFTPNFNVDNFALRLEYLIALSLQASKKTKESIQQVRQYKIPLDKRIFDIVFSSLALIMLLPIFIIIGLLIKFGSKGPIFYSSKRVGTGYRIFDFYKFRSMSEGADKKIKDLSKLNQYNKPENKVIEEFAGLCSECTEKETSCQSILYQDGETICEKMHKKIKKDLNGATFIKFKGDPRVTKVGHFIRNTSIDELPQLFNVLIGDMSIVGNRPLPLYEAEKVTTDRFITRFMAPAGITGLWQVSKRGKGKMSEDERIELDNVYATQHSFWGDIKIILMTIPALLQKENV